MPDPIPAVPKKTQGPDPKKIQRIEQDVRLRMPAAFNQLEDLERDPFAIYQWDRTERGIQYLIDHSHTVGSTVDEVRGGRHSSIRDAVMLGHAGLTFGGGACNDYSAAGLLEYMESGEPYPISRFWAPGMGHSFDVVGDTRMSGAMVLDPWLTDRGPQQFWETVLPRERLQVINEWAPRAQDEGRLLSRHYRRKIDEAKFKKSADGVDIVESYKEQQRLLERYRAAKTPQQRQELHLYRHPAHQPLKTWETSDRRFGLSWEGNTSVPFWNIRRSRVLRQPVDLDLYF